MSSFPSFWEWLIKKDRDGDRGISNLLNHWFWFHIVAAFIGSVCFKISELQLASKVAVPGAAIMVGLSFAWAGRSASLFQDKAFSEFIIRYGAPVEGYLYSFQLAILVVLIFLLLTFFIAFGGFGITTGSNDLDRNINIFFIVLLGSVALRECWGSIYFVNKLTIQFYKLREKEILTADGLVDLPEP